MKAYYDARARGIRRLVAPARPVRAAEQPCWQAERDERLPRSVGCLQRYTLDVACGTGFVTRHLPGEITGFDQSDAMLAVAAEQAPEATFVQGDALDAAVRGRRLRAVFTSHFYGHLEEATASASSTKPAASRAELVVVDAALHAASRRGEWQERLLKDGSRWEVYKRFFDRPAARSRARRRRRAVRRTLVRRSSARDAAALELPLPRLAPARQPRLPRVRRGRLPARVAARARGPRRASAPTCSARRRGSSRARSAARGAAAPGRRFAAGSTSTRTTFYATFYCASVTRCYPGARRPAAATARRRRASRSSARSGATGSSASSAAS